jgi:hypothetical protein
MKSHDQPLDLEAIEDLVRAAMSHAKAQGLVFRPRSYGAIGYCRKTHRWKLYAQRESICPITATLLYANPLAAGGVLPNEAFARLIGRDNLWAIAFWHGFDDRPSPRHSGYAEAYGLGQKFRREYDAGLWRHQA